MTERSRAHLDAEEVARFLDACGGSELPACEPIERHLRSCPECRGRVVETRLLESHLQRAFTRELVPVDDAEVLRTRAVWSAATVPVLLPLPLTPAAGTGPRAGAPADSPVVPLRRRRRRRRRTLARWAEVWRRAMEIVLRPVPLPLGVLVAGGVVLLLARETPQVPPPRPVAIPGAQKTAAAVATRPTGGVAEPTTVPALRAWTRRGAADDSARRRTPPRTGDERLAAIGDRLPPPLRAAFLDYVVGRTAPDSGCAATVARAQAVVQRARPAATWRPEPTGGDDVATDVWTSVWQELNRHTAFDVAPHR